MDSDTRLGQNIEEQEMYFGSTSLLQAETTLKGFENLPSSRSSTLHSLRPMNAGFRQCPVSDRMCPNCHIYAAQNNESREKSAKRARTLEQRIAKTCNKLKHSAHPAGKGNTAAPPSAQREGQRSKRSLNSCSSILFRVSLKALFVHP